MKKRIFIFMLIIPVLTELLSGNSPLPLFINPLYFLLEVISYGVPIILIREAVIRWNLGLKGLFTLGIGYGFLNEGVFSNTLISQTNLLGTVPLAHFIAGLNPFWTVYIVIWHALHSVIYPILLMQYFYPEWRPWLGKNALAGFFAVLFAEVILFASEAKMAAARGEIFLSLVIIVILVIASKRMTKKILTSSGTPSAMPFWLGLLFMAYTIGAIVFAKTTSFVPYALFMAAGLWVAWLLLGRIKGGRSLSSLLLFGIGDYIAFALLIMTGGAPVIIATNVIIIVLLLITEQRIRRTMKTDPTRLNPAMAYL